MEGKRRAIRNWAKDEKPREKMIRLKAATLSVSELLAIIIRSGRPERNALDLAKEISALYHDNIRELGTCTVRELMKVEGIGIAAATAIVAAFELGRRRLSSDSLQRGYIRNSREGAEYIRPLLADLDHEVFGILYLVQAGWVKSFEIISEGGITGTVVDPRVVFRKAIEIGAVSMIAFHNHPSGSIHPSKADEALTKKLNEGAKYLDIKLLDHVVVGEKGYFSFADSGLLG
ncbi:MAG TPA: DNA repair protein RadC [Puia sp.]|nr:DNA repair protein RadC [Puia sp.]